MGLHTLLQPRLCELGKIKIGRKEERIRKTQSGGEWRAPEKLDHFIITTMARDPSGDLVQDTRLMESLAIPFGDPDGKLRQIPITLLSDDIDDCMQSAWVWYNGKRVAARSDGETLTSFVDTKTGEILPEPRVSPWKQEYADMTNKQGVKLFKLHTVFNCVIAAQNSRWGGVYKFRTTSRITADQLYGSLIHLQQLTSGVLRGLPLMLVVRPLQVAPDGKPTTVYVVHVELRGPDLQAIQQQALSLAKFQAQHLQETRRAQIEFRRLLTAPGEEETVTEIVDVEEEFHPENFGDETSTPTPTRGVAGLKDRLARGKEPEQAATPTTAPPSVEPLASGPTLGDVVALLKRGDLDAAADIAQSLTGADAEAAQDAIREAMEK